MSDTWYQDLRVAFRARYPDELVSGSLPEAFYAGVTEIEDLERGTELDVLHAVEFEGATHFLMLRGPRAWLVKWEAPTTTEIVHLGDLRGGRYIERLISDGEGGFLIEATYTLFGSPAGEIELRAEIQKPVRKPGAYLSDDTESAIRRGGQLREAFGRLSHGLEAPSLDDTKE